jgi:hypothetical protein
VSRRALGRAAAGWALLFAAASAYWAAGGRVGSGTVAVALAEQAAERDPGFVATLWVAAVLKALLAVLALALAARRPGRVVRLAGWGTGAALALYGVVGLAEYGAMAAGLAAVPDDVGRPAVTWYLALWEPVWLLGGVLFLALAWRSGSGVPDREPDEGHDRAAERDLHERLGERHAEVALADERDRHELDRDHDVGDGQGRRQVGDQERQRVEGSAEERRHAGDRPPHGAAAAAGQLAVVGEPLGEAHRDRGAERGGQADEQRGA